MHTLKKLKKGVLSQVKSLPALTIQTVPTVGVENVNCTYDNLPVVFREGETSERRRHAHGHKPTRRHGGKGLIPSHRAPPFLAVGSQLSAMWPSYYDQASTMFFVLDVSNYTKISGPATEITTMFHLLKVGINSNWSKPKTVAILLNKADLATAEDVEHVTTFLRLDELCEDYGKACGAARTGDVAMVLEISSCTGYNVMELLAWLKRVT